MRGQALRALVLLSGGAMGWSLGPALGTRPAVTAAVGAGLAGAVLALEARAATVPVERLVWGVAGGGVGLLAGLAAGLALIGVAGTGALALLGPLGAYLGAAIALRRRADLAGLVAPPGRPAGPPRAVVDTSALIDGRLAEVVAAGFLAGRLVVPRLVLAELQRLADSTEASRRARGSRGLDALERLGALPGVALEIVDGDAPGPGSVDDALLRFAREAGWPLVTTDHVLARRAGLEGVTALEIHRLAAALRPVVVPGARIQVHVQREGKEPGQGVAHLDDGTLVIVEDGKRFVGHPVAVTVTSVLPTAAGRMLFARLAEPEDAA